MSRRTKEDYAELGLRDLYFFAVVVLGYPLPTMTGAHYELCEFIEKGIEQTRTGEEWHGLIEYPREHLKTTFEIARALQFIAEDGSRCQLLTSAVSDQAEETARVIKGHIKNCELFKVLYPHIKPNEEQWKGKKFRVIDDRGWVSKVPRREPSVMCIGVGSTPESFHFERISHDDLVTRENSRTKAEQEKVIEFYSHCQPLLITGGEELTKGTRYKDYDLYGWMEREVPSVRILRKELKEDEIEDGMPTGRQVYIFPEWWDENREREKREKMTVEDYYAQLYNQIMPEELQKFKGEYFRYYDELPDNVTFTLGCDPSTGLGADESAIVLVGIDPEENYYVHEVMHGIYRTAQLIEHLDDLNEQYPIIETRVETYGAQKSILDAIWSYQSEQNTSWTIEGEGGSKASKISRVVSLLQPLYERGRIYHRRGLQGSETERQLMRFGVAEKDDIPDGLYLAVKAAMDNGYWAKEDINRGNPQTTQEKLEAGMRVSISSLGYIGPTIENQVGYGVSTMKQRMPF